MFAWPFFILLAAAAILLLGAPEPEKAPVPVPPQLYSSAFQLIGTGNRLGTYYPAGNALTDWFNGHFASGSGRGGVFRAVETNGSVDNVKLLREGKLLFAMVESRIAKEQLRDNASGSLRLVWPLWLDVVHILQSSSGMKDRDFPGSGRSFFGQKNSSTYRTSMEIIDALGFRNPETELNIGTEEVMQGLIQGRISYATIQAGMPNRTVSDAVIFHDCRLLSLDAGQLEKILAKVSTARKFIIPRGFYDENQEETVTIGLPNMLVCSADTSEQLVETIVDLLVKASVHLKLRHQAIGDIPADPLAGSNHASGNRSIDASGNNQLSQASSGFGFCCD